ncbi:aminomethyl-transferring glycine dehydrogenase subunit GcvPA [Desulfothermus sp.]
MRYLPHTQEEIKEMLSLCSAKDIKDLFATIPENCKRDKELSLPGPLSELELFSHIEELVKDTKTTKQVKSFIGAGNYEHYIPSIIPFLLQRSEFFTAYTPYQPEISQGTLQAIFEYQTLICNLLSMEVSNASMYDGATALAEAIFMAIRIKRNKNVVAISKTIHPNYRDVLKTYFETRDLEVIELGFNKDGKTDLSKLDNVENLCAIAVQSPNFFGCIEDLKLISKRAKELDALFICSFTEPLCYGLFRPPGEFGADICCGEGQSLGLSQAFGGPSLGIFTSKMKYVRNLPGRLVGMTKDRDGKRGFVLTLSTREQHIRREKATSNICSNQGLCALTAAMYLAVMGEAGIKEVASQCYHKTEYLKKGLSGAGFSPVFNSTTFNEFVVDFKGKGDEIFNKLKQKDIILGLSIKKFYPELNDPYLITVTETKKKQDLDTLIREVSSC